MDLSHVHDHNIDIAFASIIEAMQADLHRQNFVLSEYGRLFLFIILLVKV